MWEAISCTANNGGPRGAGHHASAVGAAAPTVSNALCSSQCVAVGGGEVMGVSEGGRGQRTRDGNGTALEQRKPLTSTRPPSPSRWTDVCQVLTAHHRVVHTDTVVHQRWHQPTWTGLHKLWIPPCLHSPTPHTRVSVPAKPLCLWCHWRVAVHLLRSSDNDLLVSAPCVAS